ncbi:uncharacterized protein BP01DRAFT_34590 [Aspergillus saccharolyticus JOP 1030-1]|uniref:Uncharacterized protein n=1 Tax=Aspergillus saccharolyticus JOP 1030-1 TaxID=1450539 RepID=A0A318ZGB1_9EURO|nr:hypothetical protein BP01DRAFT_34590 [Aspergillus saccharolyticus JOP 1030-1]PYH46045.1 hypothetical protein BP01DRAFT_34590 [Aspergillus saccharolyticus JOP 1030-1]
MIPLLSIEIVLTVSHSEIAYQRNTKSNPLPRPWNRPHWACLRHLVSWLGFAVWHTYNPHNTTYNYSSSPLHTHPRPSFRKPARSSLLAGWLAQLGLGVGFGPGISPRRPPHITLQNGLMQCHDRVSTPSTIGVILSIALGGNNRFGRLLASSHAAFHGPERRAPVTTVNLVGGHPAQP